MTNTPPHPSAPAALPPSPTGGEGSDAPTPSPLVGEGRGLHAQRVGRVRGNEEGLTKRQRLPANTVNRSRELRQAMGKPERRLWRALHEACPDARFRRQVPLGRYYADFCSHGAKLIIEVDGDDHATREQQDARRTRFLETEGYRVIRFSNRDVIENIDGVVAAVTQALTQKAPLMDGPLTLPLPAAAGPSLSHKGRGKAVSRVLFEHVDRVLRRGRQPHRIALDRCHEAGRQVMMLAASPIFSRWAIGLGQLDPLAIDMINRADMDAIGTDDRHMLFDVAVIVHRQSPGRFGNTTTHAGFGCIGGIA